MHFVEKVKTVGFNKGSKLIMDSFGSALVSLGFHDALFVVSNAKI